MNNLLEKGKEITKKIKNQIIKIGMKKVAIGCAIVIAGITGMALLSGGNSNAVVLANVIHPTSTNYPYYTFNEVKNYNKVNISKIKLKHKENKVNNNKTLAGDVEYEFTIKNTSKETIDNIGYTFFILDTNGRPFAIRSKNTITLKSGEKKKIKVSSIWCNEDCDSQTTQLLFMDNYDKDYAILNVYQLMNTNSDHTINTKEL